MCTTPHNPRTGLCYWVQSYAGGMTWSQAEEKCLHNGGRMAEVSTKLIEGFLMVQKNLDRISRCVIFKVQVIL